MGHSVGDAAARSVKKSEKQTEKANRTPEQRISDIRKLAEAGLAVHTADVIFLLSEYTRLSDEISIKEMDVQDDVYTASEPHIPETLQE